MSRLTREQCDVFLLHLEVLETTGCKAMDHTSHTQVQRSVRLGSNPLVDWAVDYSRCMPVKTDDAELLMRAHGSEDLRLSWHESRRLGGLTRAFYRRVQRRRLYGPGLRYLELRGSGRVI